MGEEIKYTLKDLDLEKPLEPVVKKQSKKNYVIVTGYTESELSSLVNSLLNSGYTLAGGIATSTNKMQTWYHQALVK